MMEVFLVASICNGFQPGGHASLAPKNMPNVLAAHSSIIVYTET
jgi:hypothetical protein